MYTSDQDARFIIPFEEQDKTSSCTNMDRKFFESGNEGSELLTVVTLGNGALPWWLRL